MKKTEKEKEDIRFRNVIRDNLRPFNVEEFTRNGVTYDAKVYESEEDCR